MLQQLVPSSNSYSAPFAFERRKRSTVQIIVAKTIPLQSLTIYDEVEVESYVPMSGEIPLLRDWQV